MNREKILQVLETPGVRLFLGLILTVYFGVLALKTPLGTRWVDFPVYYEAATKALAHQTVYDVPGHFQYKYSPFVALLFGFAFGGASFDLASWIFQKTMLAGWMALLAVFLRGRNGLSGRALALGGITVLFFGNALRLDQQLGQINVVPYAVLWALLESYFQAPGACHAGVLARKRSIGKTILQGALFAFAIQLKLYALVFLPYFFFRKDWNLIFVTALWMLVMSLGIPALYHGWEFTVSENRAWIASLTSSTEELLVHETNVGLLGVVAKWTSLEAGKIVWALTGLVFTGLMWRFRAISPRRILVLGLYGIVLLNPLVWSYWVFLLVPLVVITIERLLWEGAVPPDMPKFTLWSVLAFLFIAFNAQHFHANWNGGILAATLLSAWLAARVESGVFRGR